MTFTLDELFEPLAPEVLAKELRLEAIRETCTAYGIPYNTDLDSFEGRFFLVTVISLKERGAKDLAMKEIKDWETRDKGEN